MTASVILPVYNKADYLAECLASIRAQDMADFEIIAVDDCSTDRSLAILESVDDARLRIVRCDRNRGPAGAMQRGIDEAGGEFLIRVDADDVCLPGRFSAQVAYMRAHTAVGLSGGSISLLHRPSAIRAKPLTHEACRAELLFGVAVHQPTAIFRSEALKRSGVRFHDDLPRWGEDWMVQLAISEKTRLGNLPQPLVRYRMGPHNSGKGRDRSADLRELTRQAFAHFGIHFSEADTPDIFIAQKHFVGPLTPASIKQHKAWLGRILADALATGRFDSAALKDRMGRAWDELCFHMPSYGHAAIMAYIACDRRPSIAKARYLLSSMVTGKRYVNDDPS
jgi:hypothetical protein